MKTFCYNFWNFFAHFNPTSLCVFARTFFVNLCTLFAPFLLHFWNPKGVVLKEVAKLSCFCVLTVQQDEQLLLSLRKWEKKYTEIDSLYLKNKLYLNNIIKSTKKVENGWKWLKMVKNHCFDQLLRACSIWELVKKHNTQVLAKLYKTFVDIIL